MPAAANASSNGSERALIRYRTAICSSATPSARSLSTAWTTDAISSSTSWMGRAITGGPDSTVASSVLRNPPRCAASSFAKPRISGVER